MAKSVSTSYHLTEHQLVVWDQLMGFLHEPEQQVFILKGYAGTGKTFLLKKVVENLAETGSHTPKLMAPTGRAAEVLRRVTKFEARTIHSQLYGRPQLEERDLDAIQLLFPLVYPDLPGPTLWIVDEASMLTDARSDSEGMKFGSGSLLNDLIRAIRLDARPEDRLLFVGDPAQLPPVSGSDFSPALEPEYINQAYRLTVQTGELTKVMRQVDESGILKASLYLRDLMTREQGSKFRLPKGPGLEAINWDEFYKKFPTVALEQQSLPVIVLTHTNDQAYRINQIVRRMRFHKADLPIQPGDWLMVDKNFYVEEHIIYNGTHVRVLEVGAKVEEKGVAVRGKKGSPGHFVTLQFREIVIETPHPENSRMFTLPILLLENSVTHPKRLGIKEQQALMVDFRERHPDWKPDQKGASDKLLGDPYYNALQARYGYAITVHKAQGGEWPDVFVNFDVAFPKTVYQQMYRWSYTAVTRASQRLFGLDLPLFTPLSEVIIDPIQVLKKVGPESRYQPPLPPSPHQPDEFLSHPFLALRHLEIQRLSHQAGLQLKMKVSPSAITYQFSDNIHQAIVSLPFGKKGFKKKYLIESDSRSFKRTVRLILTENILYAVPGMPSSGQRRVWYEHLRSVSADANWGFSHFHMKVLLDQYWFQLDNGYVRLDLHHEDRETPTRMIPYAQKGCVEELELWLEGVMEQ